MPSTGTTGTSGVRYGRDVRKLAEFRHALG